MTERINPDTGVKEELGLFGWRDKVNDSGNAERVNPDSGVSEERGLFGWREKTNDSGNAERVNRQTGVLEERGWFWWRDKTERVDRSDPGEEAPTRDGAEPATGTHAGGYASSAGAPGYRGTHRSRTRTSPGSRLSWVVIIGAIGAAYLFGGRLLPDEWFSDRTYDTGDTGRSLPARKAIYSSIAFVNGGQLLVSTDGFELRVTRTDTLSDVQLLETSRSQSNTGAGGPFLNSADGRRFFAGGDGLALWDTSAWKVRYHVRYPIPGSQLFDTFTAIAFSKDESLLFSGSIDCMVRVIDPRNGRARSALRVFSGSAFCGHAISPHAGLIASFELERGGTEVKFIRMPSLAVDPGASLMLPARAMCARFSPDGTRIAFGLQSGEVEVWDARSLQKLQKVKIGSSSVGGVAFLPGGRNLAVALISDNTVKIVDSANGTIAKTLRSGDNVFGWTVEVSPDGRWLAASEGKTVTVWNLEKLGLR